jgi:hypothetical protein
MQVRAVLRYIDGTDNADNAATSRPSTGPLLCSIMG